nr:tRNA (adenosine(37)-N6)-threonylcarbamoyltransferase complex dimerization subunit type 1 TsaB [Pseudohoeflea sp. DP4N28-3]
MLAIDCAHTLCAVGLFDSHADKMLAVRAPDIGRGHAERLPGLVDEVMTAASVGYPEIQRIAVTIGPGSFAGIRVGVAFARGLALALAIPSIGISSLRAIAEPVARAEQRSVMAAIDARRQRVWALLLDPDGNELLAPGEFTPEAAAAIAGRAQALVCGTAAPILAELNPALVTADRVIAAPEILDVARMAVTCNPADYPAEPAYLRAPDAKPQTAFAVARKAT